MSKLKNVSFNKVKSQLKNIQQSFKNIFFFL